MKDGQPITNSREDAEFFGRLHKEVMRDVTALQRNLPPYAQAWFRDTTYRRKVGFGERSYPAYDLTRDGFTLLAMSFTGPKALAVEVAYIRRFNDMAQQTRVPV